MRSHSIYRICEEMHICTYTNKLFHTHVYTTLHIPRGIRIYTVIERRGTELLILQLPMIRGVGGEMQVS